MEKLDTREWLLTNGLGSFASGTIGDAHTRTYHGWLIAALNPPNQRRLLLSHLEAFLQVGDYHYELGTNYWGSGEVGPEGYRWLRTFRPAPVPQWTWAKDHWSFSRQLFLPHWTTTLNLEQKLALKQQNQGEQVEERLISSDILEERMYNFLSQGFSLEQLQHCHRVLMHYHYEGDRPAMLTLRPLIGDRYFHHQQRSTDQLQFSQVVTDNQVLLQAIRPQWSGTPWHLRWTKGSYFPDSLWYWDYCYPEETYRGLSDSEDLYSPGYMTVTLQPGESITVEACTGAPSASQAPLTSSTFDEAISQEHQRLYRLGIVPQPITSASFSFLPPIVSEDSPCLAEPGLPYHGHPENNPPQVNLWSSLLYAADQCIVHRHSISGPTVIAGYPWLGDWVRQTLIALPGLTLTPGRFQLARHLLQAIAQYCHQGLIPTGLPGAELSPLYQGLDVSLWWIETLGLYLDATQDWAFLLEQYPTVQQIYKALMTGTIYNIRVDAVDGLLTWDNAALPLTWMNTVVEGIPVTPRCGKTIEINALWYSSLCWMRSWVDSLQTMATIAGDMDKVEALGRQAHRYDKQIVLVGSSLKLFWNPQRRYFYDRLAPDDVPDTKIRPNAVIALSLTHSSFTEVQGQQALDVVMTHLLTPYGLRTLEPDDPDYQGYYRGDMNSRDGAYYQGTVWSWLIGPFIRAWHRFYGDRPLPFDPLPLKQHIQHHICLGTVSEIFDGDAPHNPQGAVSQAWSIAELIRHWEDLGNAV